jgi:two-component system CheB/CheR fusion protein
LRDIEAEAPFSEDLRAILDVVSGQRSADFHDYRRSTLERRLATRLAATQSKDLAAYRDRLESDPAELNRLVDAFLVRVTSFFRDDRVFDALGRTVVPELYRDLPPAGLVRAWVAGVATGEEAYSVAMVLASALPGGAAKSFQVVASDLSQEALHAARSGSYAVEAIETVPEPLRTAFLEVEDDRARVSEELAVRVRFGHHDLLGPLLAPKEAVIATFDLVMCRNVLIYIDRRMQRMLVERFAGVVRPGGALVVGLAESLPPETGSLYEPYPGLDPKLRIYRRRKEPTR